MKLECTRDNLLIIPENGIDSAYLEDSLGLGDDFVVEYIEYGNGYNCIKIRKTVEEQKEKTKIGLNK